MPDGGLEFVKSHKGTLKNSGQINDRLFQPAMSDGVEFETFDGKTRFAANITCASEAPIVRVTALPVGSLSGIGELNIRIEYDRDLDGTLEGVVTVNNVGGMCGNGLITDCSPSGSWKNCRYCRWTTDGGGIRAQCDYGGDGATKAPIGPQGMRGCFCFNNSCGSPVLSMMENILSSAANGVLNELRKLNNTLVISKTEYRPESMQLSYLGSRVDNCSQSGNDNTISGLTGLYGKFEFPSVDAIKDAEADPNHPYNSIAQNFAEDGSTYQKCVLEAKVGAELKEVQRSAKTDFGIGVDQDGGSQQCYWFRGKTCGAVFGETSSLQTCIDRFVPAALSDICTQLLVNSGTFTSITNVTEYHSTSGVGNYIACYGSENDAADQLWEMTCWGKRKDDVFVCKSPSMFVDGKIIRNDPYNPKLYQGCEDIHAPTNTCGALEKRRADGECQIQTEVSDGVYTVRDGAVTGIEPTRSCRTFAGGERSITVCEPWWKRERVYRCKGTEADFSKAKERAIHVGNTINYDFDRDIWQRQGDLTWDGDQKSTRVFDPAVEFMPVEKSCIPGCRIRKAAKVTDIFVPGQGKLAADGNYHMDSDGQLSTSVNRDTVIEYIRECTENGKQWDCPLEPGETLVSGCQCFDQDSFGEVVGTLQAINMASTNMICSSGKDVGVCTPENQGVETKRIVCGDFTFGPDGEPTIHPDKIMDCKPQLWQGIAVSNQVHRVEATSAYQCRAFVPEYPEDDHVDNSLGPLSPLSAWFDTPVAESKPKIIELLKSDPRFVPNPGPGCPCGSAGTTCTWDVETSVENINREDQLGLRPSSQDPFGDAFLYFSRVGSWGGSTTGTCTQLPPPTTVTTASQPCEWIQDRKDCAETGWTNYRGAFNYKPAAYITENTYVGSIPLSSTDEGVELSSIFGVYDHKGFMKFIVVSDGCPGGVDVPGTQWDFMHPDGTGSTTTRSGSVPAACLKGSSLEVYVQAGGGDSFSGRRIYLDQIQYRKRQCTVTPEYGCQAQSATMPANCVVNGSSAFCTESGLVGPFSFALDNIITRVDHAVSLFSEQLPVGASDLQISVNRDVICTTGEMAVEYRSGSCPGWRRGYSSSINCGYHSDEGGGEHGCPDTSTFSVPNGCLGGKLEIRLTFGAQRADSRCTGQVKASVQYRHDVCGSTPKYVCEDKNACSAQCGKVTQYRCSNGLVVSDPNQCPRWTCSKLPGTSFQTQADCQSACVAPVACNAQTEDYRFKVTIRNKSNDYLSVLDLVRPSSMSIGSWAYPYEDRILQQCIDRYVQPHTSFTDPATNGKFEIGVMDLLVYHFSAQRREAARDDSSGTPWSLPKMPPVYLPAGQTAIPRSPMYWTKQVTSRWTDDDSLRLGYATLQAHNLVPYVYYYQCPTGSITPASGSSACSGRLPFSGVDWTVKGDMCFQNRCDPDAIIEPDQNLGGCGMVSDGKWQ